MAVKTLYILANTATAPGYFSDLQDGGSAPAAAAVAYGWTVAKVAASYWRGRIGATARATASQAGTFLTQTVPAIGTGTGATTAGDCFVSPTPLSGSFAAGNWVANFGMRTGAANNAGRIRFQLWAGTSRDGVGARKIGTAQDCSAVTMASTASTYTSTLTWNPGAITLVNEYLFFEVEWQNTNTGGSNSCSALFRQGESSIVTADFVAAITGTGTLSNATNPATLASAGLSASVGTTGALASGVADLDAAGSVITPVGTLDAWNTYDRTVAAIALSNGDKTATYSGSGGVRSSQTHLHGTAGKFYAEAVYSAIAGTCNFGLLELGKNYTGFGSACSVRSDGWVLINTNSIVNLGAFASGDVVGLAWDAGAKKAWFRKNGGLWDNTAGHDPSTNTGGYTSVNAGGDVPIALLTASFTSGNVLTVRTELAEFTQAVPGGFVTWMDEIPPVTGVGTLTSGIVDLDAEGLVVEPPITGDGVLQADVADLDATGTAETTGAAPWTPDLVAGLEGWHDASQLALADGAGVTVWTNLGAGAVPWMVGSPLPVFKAGLLNGKPVVRFSASEGRLRNTFSHPFEHTVVYIVRRWGANGGRCFTAPYPEGGNHLIGYHTSGYDCMHDDGGWVVFPVTYPATGTDPWRMYGGDGKPSEGVRFFLFGELKGSGPTQGNYGTGYNLNGYSLTGAEETGDFDIAEVLVYDTKLSDADRQKVEGYLAWKWGLEGDLLAGHPYKDAAPTAGAPADITGTGALAASSATITATGLTASSGTGALTQLAASLSGVGLVRATGTSVLTTGVSSLASAGLIRATGTATLTTGTATIVSTGLVRAVGTGTLTASVAALASTGTAVSPVITGTGVLTAEVSAVYGRSGQAIITGSGTLALVEIGEGPIPVLDLTVAGVAASRASPVNMTGAAAPSPYVVTCTFDLPGYEPWKAFDGNPDTTAHSYDALASATYWIKIDLGAARHVAGYKYQARNVGPYHCWKTWVLEGSNDNVAWTLCDSVAGEPDFAISEWRSYVCDTPGAFRFWRWTVTATGGISGTSAEAASLELWSGTGAFTEALACTRASGAYEQNAAGVLTWRGPNVLRVSDLGVRREDTRTNHIIYSNEFTQGWWVKENLTVTPDSAVAPDGTMTASTFTDNATDYFHRCYVFNSVVATESGAASFSVYLKNGTGPGWVRIYGIGTVNFDIVNFKVGKISGGAYAYIEKLANGWCRCIVVGPTGAGTYQPQIVMAPGDVDMAAWPTYPGSGQTLFVWGAQSETGNRPNTYHATSYIPTNGATVTRQEDVIRFSGAAKQLLVNGLGTAVLDFKTDHSDFNYAHLIAQGGGFWFWTGASGDDTVYNAWTAATNANVHMLNGAKAAAAWHIGGRYRSAAYGGEFGVALDVDVNATSDPWLGGGSFSGYFRRVAFWDRALPELDLRNLTSPGLVTGPQLNSVVSGTGAAQWVSTGTGALSAGTAALTGSGVGIAGGTGALVQLASATGAGISRSVGTSTMAATSATLVGTGLVQRVGTGALVASSAAQVAGAGTATTFVGGALYAASAQLAGVGISATRGPGVLPAQTSVSTAVGASLSHGSASLADQTAALAASGLTRWVTSAALPSQVATLAAGGMARWVAAVALPSQAATLVASGKVSWAGTGALVSTASAAGQGISSSKATVTLQAALATIEGIQGIEVVEGRGDPRAQSANLDAAAKSQALGFATLIDARSVLDGVAVGRTVGTGALEVKTDSVVAGTGQSILIIGGSISASASTVAGVGISRSVGSGVLADQRSIVAAEALVTSRGTGVLTQTARASIMGVGAAIATGTGDLAAKANVLVGNGLSRSIGTGVLPSISAEIAAAGLSLSRGPAVLVSTRAIIEAYGDSLSFGAGDLAAKANRIAAVGQSSSLGSGDLVVETLAELSGIAVAIAGGPGVLYPRHAEAYGEGWSESYGTGNIAAERAIVDGYVGIREGPGELYAGRSSLTGEGVVEDPIILPPAELPGDYPLYGTAVWYPNPGTGAVPRPLVAATGWHGRGTATWYEVTKPNMTTVHGKTHG